MNKVIERMLNSESARSVENAKEFAASQNSFTPWEGGE
jgi:hypothetical protein